MRQFTALWYTLETHPSYGYRVRYQYIGTLFADNPEQARSRALLRSEVTGLKIAIELGNTLSNHPGVQVLYIPCDAEERTCA